MIMLIRGLCQ